MIEPLLPGDPHEVAGYRLRGRLGQGGMGSVYLSYTRGGQPVALKVVRPDLAHDPEFRRRFEREVQAARLVHGPYTAPVLDSNTDDPLPWLAGAYVAGPPLSEAVREHGPLPVESVLLLIAGVAEALQSVHAAGVVHRDLKPSNVLLASDGPRVIDFGIARAADTTALTGSNVVVGTPAFMSPEQVLGKPVDFASDVFSLALVGHYAATGDHPFGQGHAQALMYRIVGEAPDLSACPAPLHTLLEPCLAKEPADRPSLAEVIEGCRRGAGVTTLVRDTGWLPAAVAHDVARREAVPPGTADDREPYRAAAGPPIPPPPRPAAPPPPMRPATVGPPANPGVNLAPLAPMVGPPIPPIPPFTAPKPTGDPPHRRPWARIIAAAIAAVAVVVAGVLVVPSLVGKDDNGAGNKDKGDAGLVGAGTDGNSGDESKSVRSKVPLVITAPSVPASSFMDKETCNGGFATYVDLEKLSVTANVAVSATPPPATLGYLACRTDANAGGDDPMVGELRFLDREAVAGFVDKPDATVEECRAAARVASLPSSVPLSILNSDVVSPNTGFCVETSRKTVVLVWITDIRESHSGHGPRTFTTLASQWKSGAGKGS